MDDGFLCSHGNSRGFSRSRRGLTMGGWALGLMEPRSDSRATSSEHLELWFHVGPPSLDLSAICEDLRTGRCFICELFISMVLTVLTQAFVAV